MTDTQSAHEPGVSFPEGMATRFIKAHGTENDFVFLVDPSVAVDLTDERVRRIADRRAGIGGDGVIRVATAASLIDARVVDESILAPAPDDPSSAIQGDEWFMDYRNADGSIAEMCGNGVRAFAHVLVAEHLVGGDKPEFPLQVGVGTRAGRKLVTIHSADEVHAYVSVNMGQPEVTGMSTATVGGFKLAGLGVDMGNPHLAAVIPNLTATDLATLPVGQPVEWDNGFFPNGVNVEILTPLENGAIHMRVHERGVGETRSCGTGTVAAAVAALADAEQEFGTVTVNIPGGQVMVDITEDAAILTGPAEIVARGEMVV
ncbi:diaminopimelate epimerase [Corynebacterium auriscanis]|uniref:diaminopimelate epimerase n=1 Tax=Corynebacterium auriscanis TaxID=99807 RepID=UPI003D157C67